MAVPAKVCPALWQSWGGAAQLGPCTCSFLHLFVLRRLLSAVTSNALLLYPAVLLTLRTLAQRYPGGQLPLLDPVADMGIQDEQVSGSQSKVDAHNVF